MKPVIAILLLIIAAVAIALPYIGNKGGDELPVIEERLGQESDPAAREELFLQVMDRASEGAQFEELVRLGPLAMSQREMDILVAALLMTEGGDEGVVGLDRDQEWKVRVQETYRRLMGDKDE